MVSFKLPSSIAGYNPSGMTKEEREHLLKFKEKGGIIDAFKNKDANSWENLRKRAEEAGQPFVPTDATAKPDAAGTATGATPDAAGTATGAKPDAAGTATGAKKPGIISGMVDMYKTSKEFDKKDDEIIKAHYDKLNAEHLEEHPELAPTDKSNTSNKFLRFFSKNKPQQTATPATGTNPSATGAPAPNTGTNPSATDTKVPDTDAEINNKPKKSIGERLKDFKTKIAGIGNAAKNSEASSAASSNASSMMQPPPIFGEDSAARMEKAKKEQDEKNAKIDAKIEEIRKHADDEYAELTKQYYAAKEKGDKKTIDEVNAAINAVFTQTSQLIQELQDLCDGDSVPLPVKLAKNIANFVINKIKIAFKKRQIKTETLESLEEALDAVDTQLALIKKSAEQGAGVNPSEVAALVSIANSILAQVGEKEGVGGPAIAIPPDALKDPAAAKAAAKAAADAIAKGTPPKPGAIAKPDGTPPKQDGTANPDASAAAAATGGDSAAPEGDASDASGGASDASEEGEQGGGGISRKHVHPKYINQVTENRNKIFKKELEIINSIRRFHRSHTIRKRDKINSILGLRKSKNHKSHGNNKNTRRHIERHSKQKNKRKSTKYIKK